MHINYSVKYSCIENNYLLVYRTPTQILSIHKVINLERM